MKLDEVQALLFAGLMLICKGMRRATVVYMDKQLVVIAGNSSGAMVFAWIDDNSGHVKILLREFTNSGCPGQFEQLDSSIFTGVASEPKNRQSPWFQWTLKPFFDTPRNSIQAKIVEAIFSDDPGTPLRALDRLRRNIDGQDPALDVGGNGLDDYSGLLAQLNHVIEEHIGT